MYQIIFTNRAKKDLKKIDKRYLLKISKYLDLLKINPFVGQKMEGEYKNFYKIKIPPIRLIYITDFINKTIWIQTIGHRGDVYK
ncbi:type II toxin-antitoxin system RelE/ParE family toxin [Candidatus Roizmanbacteria bacterium]|nr:type II toxin-antitoxin system RelE/ParE family toxin [Candidatus Roizmanbacteria bacterium]